MERLKQLWRTSLLFRRIAAGSVFVLAALFVYLGSHIPRAVSLPVDDLNAKSMARLDEQMIIKNPDVAEGSLVLSYDGSKNEIADLWLDNATLAEGSQHLLFPGAAILAPERISYTIDSASVPAKQSDTCHTTIEIRRAKGSPAVDALKLYQTDETAGAKRFRQVVLEAGASTLEIEVHTDAPAAGPMDLPACHRLLTLGDKPPIDLPPIPVYMLVQSGKIDLRFNPANPELPISTGPDQTFEAVSLGESTLRGSGLQVVAIQRSIAPRLDVRASRSGDSITFGRLKLGSGMLKIDIGRDAETAVAYANGSSLYNYDLIDEIQKNPVVSFLFAVVLGPALWKWVRRNCFARTSP